MCTQYPVIGPSQNISKLYECNLGILYCMYMYNIVICNNRELIKLILPQKLVIKPDQLIKRRGKLGLIKVNVDFEGAKKWAAEKIGQDIKVSGTSKIELND